MKITTATPEQADFIAQLMFQAMSEEVYALIGSENPKEALAFLAHFIKQKGNQYSYENVLVCVENEVIIGSIGGYDGGKLDELRKPIVERLKKLYGINLTNLEDETEEGEFYIDTLSVLPGQQGKGIGSKLIQAILEKAAAEQHKQVGLIVDKKNAKAEKLYRHLNFIIKKEKTFMGNDYWHMVYPL